MTQDERWNLNYKEILVFVNKNNRRPSKYYREERDMYNWLKRNKKVLNSGTMQEPRKIKFGQLLAKLADCQRINQYAYANNKLQMELAL